MSRDFDGELLLVYENAEKKDKGKKLKRPGQDQPAPEIYVEYCLGFVFDSSFESVVLIKKERGLHVGQWNGLGGKIEGESPLAAMNREYREEANDHEPPEWKLVGFIEDPHDRWKVHVYAGIDTDCVDTFSSDYIIDHKMDGCTQVLLDGVDQLPLAPHTMALIYASIAILKNKHTPLLSIGAAKYNSVLAGLAAKADPHRTGAAHVLDIEPEKVTKEQRERFKEAFYAAMLKQGPEWVFGILDDLRHDVLGLPRRDIK